MTPVAVLSLLCGTGQIKKKTSKLLFILLFLPVTLIAQYRGGFSITAGIAENSPFTSSLAYLQPMLMNQLYIEGGYRYFENKGSRTDDILWSPFTPIDQAHIGVFIGDYLFVNPRVTYNWYSTERSVGWAIATGMFLYRSDLFALGICVCYDRFNNEMPLDASGTSKRISFSLIADVHPFK